MNLAKKIDESQYREFMLGREEVNFLQSYEWGEAHQLMGNKVIRQGIVDSTNRLTSAWTAIVVPARKGRYLEVPGGPVVDWRDRQAVEIALAELGSYAKLQKCAYVRFRPQIELDDQSADLVASYGKPSIFPLQAEETRMIDLTVDGDKLLENMRRQTRYEVRKAEKIGIEVSMSIPAESDIRQFYELQSQTSKRQGFIQHSLDLLLAMRQAFGDSLTLYQAKLDGKLLNSALVVSSGREVDYIEAGSTVEARSYPGAYAIIWQIINQAKDDGYQRLNLWGISIEGGSNHRYAGVTTFKRGFGGRDVRYVAPHDLVIDKSKYALSRLVEIIRKKKRHL